MMTPNYSADAEMIYTPEEITDRAILVNALSAALYPAARHLFAHAVQTQTAKAGAASLCEEAGELLKDLVDELQDTGLVTDAKDKLAADLAHSLALSQPAAPDHGWLDARAQDLAVDLASFWAALGNSSAERQSAWQELMQTPARRRALATLAARYYLQLEQCTSLLEEAPALAAVPG